MELKSLVVLTDKEDYKYFSLFLPYGCLIL